jgi:MSHA biogenesis protein MshP
MQGGVACPAGNFVPGASTLGSFTVSVTCAATVDHHGGPTVRTLTATACNQPNAGSCPNTVNPGALYVERRLTVTF